MKTLIIYAHPYDKSFNHAIFTKVQQILKARKEEFSAIDLYWDNFNPAYDTRELSLFKAGKTSDPNVKKYQKLLKEANRLIFIFPVWWNDTPAIIKGFIDKVMKKQFAYNVGATGVIGHLKNIQRVEVMTTSTSPTWYLKIFCGSAIKSVFINSTLKQLGMKHIKWLSLGNIDKSSAQRRKQYLEPLVQRSEQKHVTN